MWLQINVIKRNVIKFLKSHFTIGYSVFTQLGPIHTQYFCTQYCNKKIKKTPFCQNIVVTFKKIFKLGFNKHNCPKINIFNSHGEKKILVEKYFFFLFISLLWAKMSRVNRALKLNILVWSSVITLSGFYSIGSRII